MLNKIIAFSIKNKLIIGLFILALIGFGSYQFTQLPIDAVPDITDNQVQVITVTPSLGAPDVERLITFPIEQANSNIPGLKEIRSFSRFGLSLITIVFDDDVDIYWARQQVTERLKIAEDQIPNGIGTPELAPVTTGLGEIYQYVLKPKHGYEAKYNATELRTIQDWIVKRQLISVKGVADVSSFGGRVKQYEIAINPNNLKSNGISINDVFTALEKNNENTGGAYIEKASTVLYIRAEGLIGSTDDIKNSGQPMDDVVFGHGFESHSGFRAAFARTFGKTPGKAREGDCLRVALFDTPLGPMLAAASNEAVCQLEFADRRELERSYAEMRRRFALPVVPGDNAVLQKLRRELQEYFSGARRDFTVPLTPRGTDFQQRVWRELQRIPHGRTASYETIARKIGSPAAARAVARANGANRLYLLVPCHRVIAKGGALSGYGGGVWRKRLLIELERTGKRPS